MTISGSLNVGGTSSGSSGDRSFITASEIPKRNTEDSTEEETEAPQQHVVPIINYECKKLHFFIWNEFMENSVFFRRTETSFQTI